MEIDLVPPSDELDWSRGRWLHPPVRAEHGPAGELVVEAGAGHGVDHPQVCRGGHGV
ncbi:hypothetical protein ACLQ24_13315 [Micromonospora sp. DT4]|uniref:hypothetical protein n=1 Tax=Micromonospora sp. DT4 TaxID=3393438 RepID=UPI003CF0A62E